MPFTDYFAAPSDEAAARVATVSDPRELEFEVVYAKNIDPVVLAGRLELILTGSEPGRGSAGRLGDDRYGRLIADPSGSPIVAVTDTLRDALADLDGRRRAVAEEWSTAEEFGGLFPVDFLVLLLRQLSELARSAATTNQHLYCRWSL